MLGLLAVGRTNPEIAETLFISTRTAQTHVQNIFANSTSAPVLKQRPTRRSTASPHESRPRGSATLSPPLYAPYVGSPVTNGRRPISAIQTMSDEGELPP